MTHCQRKRRQSRAPGRPVLPAEHSRDELVHRLAYNGDVVAFKMDRRQGGPSRTGGRGRISRSIRNRRATQPPAHFKRNPPGRGRLAVFPRCSLDAYEFRYGRFARALKNSQLTCGDVTIICETVH